MLKSAHVLAHSPTANNTVLYFTIDLLQKIFIKRERRNLGQLNMDHNNPFRTEEDVDCNVWLLFNLLILPTVLKADSQSTGFDMVLALHCTVYIHPVLYYVEYLKNISKFGAVRAFLRIDGVET